MSWKYSSCSQPDVPPLLCEELLDYKVKSENVVEDVLVENVKEEPECENRGYGVSEAAARAGLYDDHCVKEEVVVGPEVLQPRDTPAAQPVTCKLESPYSPDVKQSPPPSPSPNEAPKEHILQVKQDFNETGNVPNTYAVRPKLECSENSSGLPDCVVRLDRLDYKYSCPTCPSIFVNETALADHLCYNRQEDSINIKISKTTKSDLNKNPNISDSRRGELARKSILTTNQQTDPTKRFFCDTCFKTFSDKRKLNKHPCKPLFHFTSSESAFYLFDIY